MELHKDHLPYLAHVPIFKIIHLLRLVSAKKRRPLGELGSIWEMLCYKKCHMISFLLMKKRQCFITKIANNFHVHFRAMGHNDTMDACLVILFMTNPWAGKNIKYKNSVQFYKHNRDAVSLKYQDAETTQSFTIFRLWSLTLWATMRFAFKLKSLQLLLGLGLFPSFRHAFSLSIKLLISPA